MMEEDTKAQVPTAPESPQTQEIAEVVQDAEEITVDTPPASEVDVEKEESSAKQEVEAPVSKEENDRNAERVKMSKLEKEVNELRERERLLQALDSAAANDPEFMKLANKKLVEQGVLDASVLEQLEQTAQPKVDAVSPITSDPALVWAKQKMQEEQAKREEFFKKFEDDRPDLADGDPEIVRANRQAVSAAAIRRIKAGEPMDKAYDYAYKQIMHPEQLIEEGKLEGIAQAQSATPTIGAASGGVANSSGKVELTSEQKEAARLFGITEEKYSQTLEE